MATKDGINSFQNRHDGIHICKDAKRSELPMNAATTQCSSIYSLSPKTEKFVLNVMRVSHSLIQGNDISLGIALGVSFRVQDGEEGCKAVKDV